MPQAPFAMRTQRVGGLRVTEPVRLQELKRVPASEDDWLENDPRFLDRIPKARASIREGRGVKVEDADLDD